MITKLYHRGGSVTRKKDARASWLREATGEQESQTGTATRRVAVMYLVGLESKETQACLRTFIHQHRPEYRDSGTPVLTGPQAFQSREAVHGMRTAYRVV